MFFKATLVDRIKFKKKKDTTVIQSQQKIGIYLLHLKDSFMIMLSGLYFLLGL